VGESSQEVRGAVRSERGEMGAEVSASWLCVRGGMGGRLFMMRALVLVVGGWAAALNRGRSCASSCNVSSYPPIARMDQGWKLLTDGVYWSVFRE
jgi:hypothetical protein